MKRFQKILARLCLAFGGTVCGLLLVECSFRIFPPPTAGFVLDATLTTYNPSLYQRHPTQINVLAPNVDVELSTVEYNTQIRTNQLGIRGAPIGPKGKELRILAVGDSFTLGLQVEEAESWTELLGSKLSAALDTPVEVFNAGVDGYGTEQATAQLRTLATRTQADWAVLTFYLGNDFRDNTLLDKRREMGRSNRPPPRQPMAAGGGNLWLAKHSRLYTHWLVHKALKARKNDFRIQEYRDEILPFVSEPDLQRLLPRTENALNDFVSACESLNIGCILALMPPAYIVDKKRTKPTMKAFGLRHNAGQTGRPAQAIQSVYRGQWTVDLTPSLQNNNRATYLVFDPHLNAHGHAVVAEELSQRLSTILQRSPVRQAPNATTHQPSTNP